jgi:hypothetical protein
MPIEYVETCEEEGMSWAEYYIGFDYDPVHLYAVWFANR